MLLSPSANPGTYGDIIYYTPERRWCQAKT
jgi:hypothetical protein